MAEKKIVYQNRDLKFEGLFDMKELFRSVFKWFNERNYDMLENKNYEEIYEDGKQITFELIPYKKVTDYHKLEIRIWAVFKELKEVEVEIKGVKRRLLKGKASFSFDASLITDYEGRMEGRPWLFFFRAIVDKFIYKSQTDAYESQLLRESKGIQEEIKAYLNMFRYMV